MKLIVANSTSVIHVNDVNFETGVIIAISTISKNARYYLKKEEQYIFRDLNREEYGLCGWFNSVKDCIEKAIEVGFECYVFSSWNDAIMFLNKLDKK